VICLFVLSKEEEEEEEAKYGEMNFFTLKKNILSHICL
jgi:hypothetical protein